MMVARDTRSVSSQAAGRSIGRTVGRFEHRAEEMAIAAWDVPSRLREASALLAESNPRLSEDLLSCSRRINKQLFAWMDDVQSARSEAQATNPEGATQSHSDKRNTND